MSRLPRFVLTVALAVLPAAAHADQLATVTLSFTETPNSDAYFTTTFTSEASFITTLTFIDEPATLQGSTLPASVYASGDTLNLTIDSGGPDSFVYLGEANGNLEYQEPAPPNDAVTTLDFVPGDYTFSYLEMLFPPGVGPSSVPLYNGTLSVSVDEVTVEEPGGPPTQVSATPEPSSLAMLGTGLLGVISVVRRRARG